MWRLGFPTPKDIDDNQSYCGGYGVQWGSNGGKCGICGDPWNETPRAHEAPGGLYATGIIGKGNCAPSRGPRDPNIIVIGGKSGSDFYPNKFWW